MHDNDLTRNAHARTVAIKALHWWPPCAVVVSIALTHRKPSVLQPFYQRLVRRYYIRCIKMLH